MRTLLARFLADESGATALEYGLIIALIFLVILSSMTTFGNVVTTMFNNAMNAISASM